MSRAEELWERLVRAALRRQRSGADAYGRVDGGIAANVPSSLANNRDIDDILRAADEIQDQDPNVARICECFPSVCMHVNLHSLLILNSEILMVIDN